MSAAPPAVRNQIFISYSHRDVLWLEELQLMLKPALRYAAMSVWSDQLIRPGEEWLPKIEAALAESRMALLLVSKHFLASDFITQTELPAILRMRDRGLQVHWILCDHCLYQETALNAIQSLHDLAHPLAGMKESERARALAEICRSIRNDYRAADEPATVRNLGDTDAPRPASRPAPTRPSAPPSARADATDRNLLFGVTAVHLGFITRDQFAEACSLWSLRDGRAMADVFREQELVDAEDLRDIERAVERRLRKHLGDVPATLSAAADGALRSAARSSGAANIIESIDSLPDDGLPTALPAPHERYAWRSLHARGKLGHVWNGSDGALEREVALKIVAPEQAADDAAHRKLLREARITARLQHPHIVPVYDCGERSDGQPFYAMRMLRGPTLAEQIRRHHAERVGNRVDPAERRRLLDHFRGVCFAVAYSHSQGVLHLDLKPQNVVLGEFGEVYLIDWGLARSFPIAPTETGAKEPTAVRFGTPAYMSPEQAAGRLDQCDVRTDVYGLGAILCEILCGEPPHAENDAVPEEERFERIRSRAVRSPRDRFEGTPPALDAICLQALKVAPNERIASAEEFALAVQRWLDEEPLSAYRANIGFFEKQLERDPKQHSVKEGLARELTTLGLMQRGMGRFAGAEHAMTRAIELYSGLCEFRPREPRYRADLATARLHLAYLLVDAGKLGASEQAKRDALGDYRLLARVSPGAEHLSLIASRLHDMGVDPAGTPETPGDGDPRPQAPALPRPGTGDIASEARIVGQLQHPDVALASDTGEQPLVPPARAASESPSAGVSDSIVSPPQSPPAIASGAPSDSLLAAGLAVRPGSESNARLEVEAASLAGVSSSTALPAPPIESPDAFATMPAAPFEREVDIEEPYRGPRYRLVRALAEGGFGRLHMALDRALNRTVVLKELRSGLSDDGSARLRFLAEARITAALDHPGVVPIYSLGYYPDGAPFYTMKLIQGKSFQEEIREVHERLGERPAAADVHAALRRLMKVVVQTCQVIAYAHARGVVHRDIKPSNVLTGSFGETYLVDWGLAKLRSEPSPGDEGLAWSQIDHDRSIETTQAGAVIGTPAFMSPEQASAEGELGPASDVYSLGATLYYALTGKYPYDGRVQAVLEQVRRGEARPPAAVTPFIPRALNDICLKAMARRPEDRYPSAEELANDLEDWLAGAAKPGLMRQFAAKIRGWFGKRR